MVHDLVDLLSFFRGLYSTRRWGKFTWQSFPSYYNAQIERRLEKVDWVPPRTGAPKKKALNSYDEEEILDATVSEHHHNCKGCLIRGIKPDKSRVQQKLIVSKKNTDLFFYFLPPFCLHGSKAWFSFARMCLGEGFINGGKLEDL